MRGFPLAEALNRAHGSQIEAHIGLYEWNITGTEDGIRWHWKFFGIQKCHAVKLFDDNTQLISAYRDNKLRISIYLKKKCQEKSGYMSSIVNLRSK